MIVVMPAGCWAQTPRAAPDPRTVLAGREGRRLNPQRPLVEVVEVEVEGPSQESDRTRATPLSPQTPGGRELER